MKHYIIGDRVGYMGRLSQCEKVLFWGENHDFGVILSSKEKIYLENGFKYQFRYVLSILTALKQY